MLVYQLKLLKGKIQNEEINQVSKIKGDKYHRLYLSWNPGSGRKAIEVDSYKPLLPGTGSTSGKKKKNPE